MNKRILMAFVLASGMALAQAGGGSAGSTSSTDQNQNPQSTTAQPSSSDQQQSTTPSTQTPGTTDQNNQSNPSQTSPSNPSSATATSSGQDTVLRGCLKQSGGNWVISQNGQDTTLTGDDSMLKPHDGHQVEVHGTQSSGGSLQVSSVNMISESCTGSDTASSTGAGAAGTS
jgi:cytoskeletal protein RodZ